MEQLKNNVCAGIVLYNPEIELLEKNIIALIPQTKCIFLYDNASKNAGDIDNLLKKYPDIMYQRGNANDGIAAALNRIIDFAEKEGYEWCLTMDQDSVCSDNLILEYSKCLKENKAALLCPFVLNNGKYTLEQYQALNLPYIEYNIKPDDCITSAALHHIPTIRAIGGYNEKLFIDCVDTDLNCRILKSGNSIIRCNTAYLIQAMGKAKNIPFLTRLYQITNIDLLRRMQTVAVYSDQRLYYQSRNSRYIRKAYGKVGKRFLASYMFMLFFYFTLVYPKSHNRISMWKNIMKGYRDGKEL